MFTRESVAFLATVSLTLAIDAAAWAQVPAGPEFRVNTYTSSDQSLGRAAMSREATTVVWNSNGQDGDLLGIFARHYDANGAPLGGEFQVNTQVIGHQWQPTVCRGRHNVVVAWMGPDGFDDGVFARVYDRRGIATGPEFRVNTSVIGGQAKPEVACRPGGEFLVTWSSKPAPGNADVFARRFDSRGVPLGGEFQVNTYTSGYQENPSAAFMPDGGFVVVWTDWQQDSGTVPGRRFDASGAPIGGEFRVNSYTTGFQGAARSGAVAAAEDGRFVVSWLSRQDGDQYGVMARVFDASAAPLTGEIQVNTYTTGSQDLVSVAGDAAGNFVVSWRSRDQDYYGVFAQRLARDGSRRGQEFQVNTYTTDRQDEAAVASDRFGNFLLLWASMGQDGSSWAQMGRRYGGLLPAALAVDVAGNGVLEPNESVAIVPTWHNVNTAALAFTGAASNLTGPAGATYTLTDGTADYGFVPSGSSASCTANCYGVSIAAPSRPVLHWDATWLESILPDSLGQRMAWSLHLGDSFGDVPRTRLFYRFVETLLHHGVTGGCGGASFCPAAATSREQMTVFVLAADEGPGYAPPACASAPFADVPPASAFCPWIQELARRSVVSGCGGGNFCPADAVTREQMAVFVLRALDPALNPPACTTPVFADVPASSSFCRWIEELARRGVVAGCGGGNYCPADPVTREQTAVFLTLTFGLTLYGP